MTIKIAHSQALALGFSNIQADIEHYASEVRNWLNQEKMVIATQNAENPIDRYASYPHPVAHDLVVAAVDKTGNPDYVIVDDTAAMEQQTLEDTKDKLFSQTAQMFDNEQRKIVPRGKETLISLHEARINDSDNIAKAKITNDWRLEGKHDYTQEEMNDVLKIIRTPEDQQFMEELSTIKEQLKALQWWRAEQDSAIADLTVDTVTSWQPAPFKG